MLENLKFSFSESSNQSHLFSINHIRYDVVLSNNGITHTFQYQCNKNREATLEDVLECIVDDTVAYSCHPTLEEFMITYDGLYESNRELINAYKECKEEHNKMAELFNKEEFEYIVDRIDYREPIIEEP